MRAAPKTGRAGFTAEEKALCMPTAHKMISLACMAKYDGILSLESELCSGSDFLKMGIALLLEGAAPDELKEALGRAIEADGHTGAALLERRIIAEGLAAIARGVVSTDMVRALVGSHLGEKHADELLSADHESAISVEAALGKRAAALPESGDFEARMGGLSKLEFFYVLMSQNMLDLAPALMGCSGDFLGRVRECLGEGPFAHICRAFGAIGPMRKEDILEAQKRLIEHADGLMAEICPPDLQGGPP